MKRTNDRTCWTREVNVTLVRDSVSLLRVRHYCLRLRRSPEIGRSLDFQLNRRALHIWVSLILAVIDCPEEELSICSDETDGTPVQTYIGNYEFATETDQTSDQRLIGWLPEVNESGFGQNRNLQLLVCDVLNAIDISPFLEMSSTEYHSRLCAQDVCPYRQSSCESSSLLAVISSIVDLFRDRFGRH